MTEDGQMTTLLKLGTSILSSVLFLGTGVVIFSQVRWHGTLMDIGFVMVEGALMTLLAIFMIGINHAMWSWK